ncbi:MAG: WecB/TagA/CpsF family glycosyltransferase [Candidatus Hydrogenedentota bacterium]
MSDQSSALAGFAAAKPASRTGVAVLQHTTYFDVPMHNLVVEEALDAIDQRILEGRSGFVVTPNVDHVCRYRSDPTLRDAYRDAFLSLPDGTPIIWASQLLGRPLRQKISGSDLVYWLSERAAHKRYRVFFFGAAPGVAETAADKLSKRYAGLNVVGTYSPPMGFDDDPEESRKAIDIVARTRPDIVFVALGCPRQERWCRRVSALSDHGVFLPIGAGLDFAAGKVRRAPLLLQRIGFEWAWRIVQDPRRLAKRYLVDDLYFFVLLWRELWAHWRSDE